MKELIARGVEIAPDGTVFGLAKIHHWCGNDPVRLHIARVDVAKVLSYLGEVTRMDGTRWEKPIWSGGFDEHGWNVSDYYAYKEYLDWVKFENARRHR